MGLNPLVAAFNANSEWKATHDARLAELTAKLKTGGALAASLDSWIATIKAGACDLVSAQQLDEEAAQIRKYA